MHNSINWSKQKKWFIQYLAGRVWEIWFLANIPYHFSARNGFFLLLNFLEVFETFSWWESILRGNGDAENQSPEWESNHLYHDMPSALVFEDQCTNMFRSDHERGLFSWWRDLFLKYLLCTFLCMRENKSFLFYT